jgi:hypothetical protein
MSKPNVKEYLVLPFKTTREFYRNDRRYEISLIENLERSPWAKAAAGLPAAVGNTTRGFESLPSPPLSLEPVSACRPHSWNRLAGIR